MLFEESLVPITFYIIPQVWFQELAVSQSLTWLWSSLNIYSSVQDCRIVVYEEFFGVYKMVEKGKESWEFFERHCRKLSWIGSESSNEGCKNRKTKNNRMEEPEQAILLLFFLLLRLRRVFSRIRVLRDFSYRELWSA